MHKQSLQLELTTAGTVYSTGKNTGYVWEISTHPDNTGNIFVGRNDPNVSSTTGYYLHSDRLLTIEIPDISKLYFVSTVSGDRVTIIRIV